MKDDKNFESLKNNEAICRYYLRWGNTPNSLDMVFISDMVDSPQKAIDEFYENYPNAFCDHPKPYKI